jgi:hypothetical protein
MAPVDDDALEALSALVAQILGSGYRDRHGHPLENNLAFRDAIAVLMLRGRLRP